MNAREIIEARMFPGWWLEPSGELHKIDVTHQEWACKRLGITYPAQIGSGEPVDGFDRLVARGWRRVSFEPPGTLYVNGGRLNARQSDTIDELASDLGAREVTDGRRILRQPALAEAVKSNPFPESKVQQVVYHGTGAKFSRFRRGTFGIIWFTTDKERILRREVGAQGHGYIVSLYVDIRNPANWKQYDQLLLAQYPGFNLDGAVLPHDGGKQFDGFVFSPKQTRIVSVDQV